MVETVQCEHVGMTMTESGSSSFFGLSGFWLLALIAVSLRVAWELGFANNLLRIELNRHED